MLGLMKTGLLWRYRSARKFLKIQSFQPMENMFCTYKQRHNLQLKRKQQYLLLPYCELPFTYLIVLLQASTMLPTYKAMHCWVLHGQQAKSFGNAASLPHKSHLCLFLFLTSAVEAELDLESSGSEGADIFYQFPPHFCLYK